MNFTSESISQGDPIGRETLTVSTPVSIKLDNPQVLAVVYQVRHVSIREFDNIVLLSKYVLNRETNQAD